MTPNRSTRRSAAGRHVGLVVVLAAWLLAGACGPRDPPQGMTGSPEGESSSGAPAFVDITAARGIDFVHHALDDDSYQLPAALGAGCAVFDANGDGRPDLYFVDTGTAPEAGAPNRLFIQGTDGSYHDATETSGLGDAGFGIGVATGDVDNDGDLDVYVGNWGRDRLYLNDGQGGFTDATDAAGFSRALLTSSVGFLDYDQDGHLDLFVIHYVVPDPDQICHGKSEGREFCSPQAYRHSPDALFRNRGDGTFEDVSLQSGIGEVAASGLGLAVDDFDGDGWPDVYVANDQVANQLWMNQRDGTFRNEAIARGVAYNGQAIAESSMGVVVADLNHDRRPDVLCSHLAGETNTLYLSDGSMAYSDSTDAAAPGRPSFAYTGWGMALFDADHDGDLDLAVANGDVESTTDASPDSPLWSRYTQRNQFFVNSGAPAFRDDAGVGGDLCRDAEVSRGLAAADLDADGDLDLVITNVAGPARVFENVAPKHGHWLRVRAVDPALRRAAIGARVWIAEGERERSAIVGAAGSYLSAGPKEVHFGLPEGARPDEISVRWPGGDVERFPIPGLDRELVLTRGDGSPAR